MTQLKETNPTRRRRLLNVQRTQRVPVPVLSVRRRSVRHPEFSAISHSKKLLKQDIQRV